MPLFACRACTAKDNEIEHLIYELGEMHKQLTRALEATAPGSVARAERALEPRPRIDAPPPRVRIQTLPGYEPEFDDNEVEVS